MNMAAMMLDRGNKSRCMLSFGFSEPGAGAASNHGRMRRRRRLFARAGQQAGLFGV